MEPSFISTFQVPFLHHPQVPPSQRRRLRCPVASRGRWVLQPRRRPRRCMLSCALDERLEAMNIKRGSDGLINVDEFMLMVVIWWLMIDPLCLAISAHLYLGYWERPCQYGSWPALYISRKLGGCYWVYHISWSHSHVPEVGLAHLQEPHLEVKRSWRYWWYTCWGQDPLSRPIGYYGWNVMRDCWGLIVMRWALMEYHGIPMGIVDKQTWIVYCTMCFSF